MNIQITLPNADQIIRRDNEMVLKILKRKADLAFGLYMFASIVLLVMGAAEKEGPLIGMGITLFAVAVGRRVSYARMKAAFQSDIYRFAELSRRGTNEMKLIIDSKSIKTELNFHVQELSWAVFSKYALKDNFMLLNTSSYGYGLVIIDLSVIGDDNRVELEAFVKGLMKRG